MTNTPTTPLLPEDQLGPAERLLALVLNGSAHLWHNRPGLDLQGTWHPATARRKNQARFADATPVAPGLFVPAAVGLYRQLLEIYQLNAELMAHFASYALKGTEWRDLKVACAALMLVQPKSGQPIHEEGADGQKTVAFHDDDFREIGEAMLLFYEKDSKRMLTPKAVLRVAQLLETPEIAALNRQAGFADPAASSAPLGRWRSAARQWLRFREANLPLLEGLVKAGYKETIKKLARKAGYKPISQKFFEVLGWAQTQTEEGHRSVGLGDLELNKRERFDGLSEEEICERIVADELSYKDVVGRLPAELGLTPAILVALLPSLSDRDLRQLTPTLENLGLLEDEEIRARWERAVESSTDQRALNIAKNVRDEAVRDKLTQAADRAITKAVEEATQELDVHVMFLVDKSASMVNAIEQSKEAIARILAGFPLERLHVACFDTMGTVLKPKSSSRAAVEHMLKSIRASGGTIHAAGVRALHQSGVRFPPVSLASGVRPQGELKLVVIVAGDEAGEPGQQLAEVFEELGYRVDAMALIKCDGFTGNTVRQCALTLGVPFSEVEVEQFEDPYQVPRVLKALLEAPRLSTLSQPVWVERVMTTELVTKASLAEAQKA